MQLNTIIEIVIMLLLWVIAIGILVYIKLIDNRKENLDRRSTNMKNIDRIEYTDKTLEFIKRLTMQISVTSFRTFMDEHDIDKITKIQIQKLVTETATKTKNSLAENSIDYSLMIVTSDLVDNFIVQTAVNSIKDLLSKAVDGTN